VLFDVPACPAAAAQVFYELHAERERQGKQGEVAIVRLEQLAPFPFDLVCRELYRCGVLGS
jgi:2-oxoglutarate dehydrogenase E1 component